MQPDIPITRALGRQAGRPTSPRRAKISISGDPELDMVLAAAIRTAKERLSGGAVTDRSSVLGRGDRHFLELTRSTSAIERPARPRVEMSSPIVVGSASRGE